MCLTNKINVEKMTALIASESEKCKRIFTVLGKTFCISISKEEKILDYDGAIGVTVRDNLLLVQKNDSYDGNGDTKEEQEFYWGTDTRVVKKLW